MRSITFQYLLGLDLWPEASILITLALWVWAGTFLSSTCKKRSTENVSQGGDSAAGTQALPVGKIIDDKVCRKNNQKGIANLHMRKDI